MYPLSLLPAVLLVGTFLQNAVAQEAPPVPDILPPAAALSEEDTPPPPIAAPLQSVEVTPPHLIELQQKLRDHPGQRRAEQRVCEAQWGIMLGKSNYYPKLNATLSGGHEARLTLVEAEGEYNAARDEYEAVVANFRAEAARELAEVKTRANQAGAREDAFRAKVRHADVRATASGIVTAVHVKTVGAVVQAGAVLAEIVPDEQAVLVQARILSEDIGGVYPGQVAQVSLSAYDVSRYGNLKGEVQRIAQNTTQEQNLPPFYETLIAIPKPKLSKSDEEVEIVPGMTVMVDLIGQKRTVLNYIMTPLNRAAGVAFREN